MPHSRATKIKILEQHKLPDIKSDYYTLCDYFIANNLSENYKICLSKYIENFFNFRAIAWDILCKEYGLIIEFEELKKEIERIKSFDKYLNIYE